MQRRYEKQLNSSYSTFGETEALLGKGSELTPKQRTGHYPERVLVDKIYRNWINRDFCKKKEIRMSGTALGRPKQKDISDKKQEYRDNADRIAVERAFALAKHSYGLGLLVTKLDKTTRNSIALSFIAMNVDRILSTFLSQFLTLIFSRYIRLKNTLKFMRNKMIFKLIAC